MSKGSHFFPSRAAGVFQGNPQEVLEMKVLKASADLSQSMVKAAIFNTETKCQVCGGSGLWLQRGAQPGSSHHHPLPPLFHKKHLILLITWVFICMYIMLVH